MPSPLYVVARLYILIPLSICLVVMIVSKDVLIRALTIIPIALLIAFRDILLIKDMERLNAKPKSPEAKG